jgi:Fur family transcriptional regulator, ferric uptake regulator
MRPSRNKFQLVGGEMVEQGPGQSAEEIFKEFLVGKGLRLTAPRSMILKLVNSFDRHFELSELEAKLGLGAAHRATLFRTLPLLVEAGILCRVRQHLDHWHYEKVVGTEHHDHLFCVSCGKVVEFNSPAMERSQRRLCREHGFSELSHSFILRGLCASCKARK